MANKKALTNAYRQYKLACEKRTGNKRAKAKWLKEIHRLRGD